MNEDFLAVVQAKRFLGREFLTWLVRRIEEGEAQVEHDGQVTEIRLGDRVVLTGGADDRARLTVVGEGDVRAELGAGLRRGKLIDRARLVFLRGERRWELTLDGGLLSYEALRAPALGDRDTAAQEDPRAALENDLFLRLADIDDVIGLLDRLFAEFCSLRASKAWTAAELPALRAWVQALG
jgi:hypothetical protein